MKKYLLLPLFFLIASCSGDDPVNVLPVNAVLKGSEDMWMPVGDVVTYTYASVGIPDTFNLIKMGSYIDRNLQEYIDGEWKVTMPNTNVYGIGFSPSTKQHMRDQFLGSITGVGFHQDSTGRYTLFAISDYVTTGNEVDVIKLPKILTENEKVVYADDGRYYEYLGISAGPTFWGETIVASIRIGSEKKYQVFHFVTGKGIQQCDVYDDAGLIESYKLIGVKEGYAH